MRTHTHQHIRTTAHATARAQQRGIPPLVLDWLIRYGDSEWDHHGSQVKYFTRRSRRRVESAVGSEITRRLHEYLDCYAVVGLDGSLVTCGHRYKRLHRQ